MRLWNTLGRARQELAVGKAVRLYVCGITPYDTTHLGHARTYLLFDVLVRELERAGHEVRYVQNVTDVDDPLFERAEREGRTIEEVAGEYTRIFAEDMQALGVRAPDALPRASAEVPAMQRLIGQLVESGHAYARDGRVYYRTSSFPRFGELSRLSPDRMVEQMAEHGEDPSDPARESPLDFRLWKPSRPREASWPSPWGDGRPGWHVECSAMAVEHLGPQLDIHGGGDDLIFPHHECEAAQSEAATGRSPFASHWMHVAMVRLDGTKMSKSLGNLVLVRDLLPRFSAAALRHYLLGTHYRDPLDYAEADLRHSVERIGRLRAALQSGRQAEPGDLERLAAAMEAALADDLNTPAALDTLDRAADLVLAGPSGGSREESGRLSAMAERLWLLGERSDWSALGVG